MTFPADTWENRQKEYRRQEDREDALHRAKYPQHFQPEEKRLDEIDAAISRSFYKRKYGRAF